MRLAEQHDNREPVPLAEAVVALISLSDERDRYLDRILAAELRGYQRGREDGYDAGYKDCAAGVEAIHRAIYDHLAREAETERRRWGPRGRAHFADPRPGDYQGQDGAA